MRFKKYQSFILLIFILILASFLRLWQIDSIPPGLYPDVAINANDALDTLKTGQFKIFYPENNGREGLFIWLIALSFKIFGPSVWSLRLVSALIGILTILGLYLFAKELFRCWSPCWSPGLQHDYVGVRDSNIALIASFFLAISFWHINFSRLGFRAILVPFFLVWSFYFLFKGINSNRQEDGGDAFGRPRIANGHGFVEKREILKGLEEMPFSGVGLRAGMVLSEAAFKRPNEKSEQSTAAKFLAGEFRVAKKHFLKAAPIYFILAGLFFGFGFYTYIAFRTAVLILAAVFLLEVWNYWQKNKPINRRLSNLWQKVYLKDGWWKWDLMFLTIILTILPLGIYFYQLPGDFIGRSADVSVFNAPRPWLELSKSALLTLGMFNFSGDFNWRHNYSGSPMLVWPVGLFFILGFILTAKNLIQSKNISNNSNNFNISIFLLAWFIAMLLPAVLTIEGIPHALRAIGVIPVVYILASLGLFWLIDRVKKLKPEKPAAFLGTFLLISIPLAAALSDFNQYFFKWAKNPNAAGAMRQDLVDLADYLNQLPENIQKYVIINESGVAVPYPDGLAMPAQTLMFINYQTCGLKPETCIIYLKPEQIQEIQEAADESSIFVFLKDDKNLIEQLLKKLPLAKHRPLEDFILLEI